MTVPAAAIRNCLIPWAGDDQKSRTEQHQHIVDQQHGGPRIDQPVSHKRDPVIDEDARNKDGVDHAEFIQKDQERSQPGVEIQNPDLAPQHAVLLLFTSPKQPGIILDRKKDHEENEKKFGYLCQQIHGLLHSS